MGVRGGEPRHIVSFSGGKDSTAMLLMMLERGMQVDEILAFDTGWEFPEMYEHWKQVEEYIGREITVLKPKRPFEYWMLERDVVPKDTSKPARRGYGWPSVFRRWCTREKRGALSKGFSKCDFRYVGIAADERERERAGILYPIIEWGITEADALSYCYDKGFTWGGLYNVFHRVSCYCCPLQPLGGLRNLRKHFPNLWQKMLDMDSQVSLESKGFKDYPDLQALEARFAREDMQVKLFDEEPLYPTLVATKT